MISEFAPAKINLYLHVLGKRPDGYHELESLVVFADIGDSLQLQVNDDAAARLKLEGDYAYQLERHRPNRSCDSRAIHLQVEKADVDSPRILQEQNSGNDDNLVYRAAQEARRVFGIGKGLDITLTKNLPIAAGIGGGSADAAATLRGIGRLWNLSAEDPRWQEIARQLGSDVPVCLRSRTSIMKGRGERIESFSGLLPPYLVLVNPNRSLETRAVFEQYRLEKESGFRIQGKKAKTHFPNPESRILTPACLQGTRNDLEEAAIALLPEIKTILDLIEGQKQCLFARMSGSGATCFGLFEQAKQATRAAQAIQTLQPGWWVRTGRIIEGNLHGR